MPEAGKCILCGNSTQSLGHEEENKYKYQCPNCGTYIVSDIINVDGIDKDIQKHILSGYAHEISDGGKEAYFSTNSLKNIIDSPLIPQSPLEKLDKLLIWYYRRSDSFGKYIRVSDNPAICYAVDKHELKILYEQIIDRYLVKIYPPDGNSFIGSQNVYLSLEGHRYCKDLLLNKRQTKNAFVAMWFGNEVSNTYKTAIEPAIEECGFRPVRVDNVEHNNDITDEIIAGIKDSRFVVADMTGYRGGVYYEAGYARGLGIPVIFTCRKDWFDGEKDDEGKTIKEKIHFDIDHQNIIVWETGDDLKKRIIDRIRATIL